MGYYRQIHTKSFWDKFAENLAKLELFCVHGCGKCVFLTQKPGSHQRRVPRAGCGDASILVLSLWSENLAKLELFCVRGYLVSHTRIPEILIPQLKTRLELGKILIPQLKYRLELGKIEISRSFSLEFSLPTLEQA